MALFIFLAKTSIGQLPLPYSENFDGAWTTLPTASWTNTFAGNQQWHREDYTTGWDAGSSGLYAPSGANSSAHSARFHTYWVSSGLTGEFITPALDFSAPGPKTLEFYYINTSGTDKLQVYLSTDGGATWGASLTTPTTGIITSTPWNLYSISLGSSTSNNCKIKFTATSDYGSTDIGIDEIVVKVAVPMAFSSATTTQANTTAVSTSSTNQEIVCVQITTAGMLTPFNATGFTFNTNGSTAPGTDITNAKLWYTGNSSTFATTTQVGSTVASPNGVFLISPSQALVEGVNYFWLTYDIPAGAVTGDVVDAQCTQITMSGAGGTQVPTVTAPSGNRPIQNMYLMSNVPVTTCGGVFTDAGGPTGNYSNNENYTKTFTSANGTHLRFDFTSYNTEASYDLLKVYDGPTTASPQIGNFNGTSLPASVISTGTTLTFKFTSDGWYTYLGWSANITCVDIPPCVGNPPADDDCITATPINNLNGFCGNTSSAYYADAPGNLASVFCVGSIDNNSWFSFIADSTAVELMFLVSGCVNGDGIQAAIYETSDCNSFSLVSSCWNPFIQTNGVISASGLTVGQQYYLLVDGFDGDDCDYVVGASSGVQVSLPIELTYFEAQCNNGLAVLNWQTATETNNDYFTIEKSSDLSTWNSAGVVNGAGNSNSPITYRFTDINYAGGEMYYRIKQTDFDGHYSYSPVQLVSCSEISIEGVFPNPADDNILITINSKEEQLLQLSFIDQLGRRTDYNRNALEGLNEFKFDVSDLSAGLYSIVLITNEGLITLSRFIKK